MAEWKTYKLGDVADIQTGPFGSQLHNKDYALVGSPIVTVEHLGNRHFTTQNLPLVSDTDKARLSKYILSAGDIVFSRVGSVDRCSYVSDKEIGWLFSGRCLRVRCNREVYPLYIYYYFCLESVKQYIRNVAVGATMPSINTQIMSEIPISLPGLEEQRRIAGILSAIDDRIENNRRINTNLELQAQALYKQWFVDFDFPNEDGKPYKSSGGKMVDSELGQIPEGWRVGTLSDLANVTMGQSPNGKSFNENGNGIVFYQGRTEFGVRYPSIRLYTTEPTRYAEPMSVLLSVRAPVGDINIATQRCCIGRGVASIKSKTDDNAYMYCCLKELRPQLDQYNGEGTVFGSINRKELEGLVLCIPKYEIISKFNDVILGTDKQMLNSFQQTQTLATLRDTLLPKLMNGEIKTE